MIEKKQVVGGEAFPVGSIFVAVVATNPSALLGYGTWTSFAAGRMMVGYDAGDPDFDTVLETGGSKTANHSHTAGTLTASIHSGLSIDAHGSHAHVISNGNITISPHSGVTVSNHTWAGDLSHGHTAGSLTVSPHTGLSIGDHLQTSFNHNHAVSTATGNFVISSHSGFSVNDHPIHQHIYDDVISHTHTIPAGFGSHRHPQQAFSGTSGLNSGAILDTSASSVVTSSLYTDYAGLPQTTVPSPAGAPSYGTTGYETTSITNHTVNQPSAHTVSGSTESNYGAAANIVHSVSQPSSHSLSGTIGNPTTIGSVIHSVNQPSAHTIGGATDGGGSTSHSITSSYSNHTITGDTGSTSISTIPPYIVVFMWQRTA